MKNKIKLYGYSTSPYVRKVAAYLYYKQLEFEHVWVNPVTNKEIEFTGGTVVPVLQIDDEWRRESSELGIWLEEKFSERPILGNEEAETEKILAIDRWVSEAVIPAGFSHLPTTPILSPNRAKPGAWRKF